MGGVRSRRGGSRMSRGRRGRRKWRSNAKRRNLRWYSPKDFGKVDV